MIKPYYENINTFMKNIVSNIKITYKGGSRNLRIVYIQQKSSVITDGKCVAIKNDVSKARCSRNAKKGSDVCGLHSDRTNKFRKITDNIETIFSITYIFTIHSTTVHHSTDISCNTINTNSNILHPFEWRNYKCLINYNTGKLYYKLSNNNLFIISNLHSNNPRFYLHAEMV
mgnify:FL=1